MYYKRISDLLPLGKPKNGDDWTDISPIVISSDTTQVSVNTEPKTISYLLPSSQLTAYPVSDELKPYMDQLTSEFQQSAWCVDDQNPHTYEYETVSFIESNDQESGSEPIDPDSKKFLKSLWFEVAISKDENGKPTAKTSNIHHYQSKRMNAFAFLNYAYDDLSASVISSSYIECKKTLNANEISSKVFIANDISSDAISAIAADISSIQTNSLVGDAISSKLGIITDLSGDYIYYKNSQFDRNLDLTNLSATNAHYSENLVVSNEISSKNGWFTDISTRNITAQNANFSTAIIDDRIVAEIMIADRNYCNGTLIQFSKTNDTYEISAASNKVNGVVTDTPYAMKNGKFEVSPRSAIILNSNLLKQYYDANTGLSTDISAIKYDSNGQRWEDFQNQITKYLDETPGTGFYGKYPKAVIFGGREKTLVDLGSNPASDAVQFFKPIYLNSVLFPGVAGTVPKTSNEKPIGVMLEKETPNRFVTIKVGNYPKRAYFVECLLFFNID